MVTFVHGGNVEPQVVLFDLGGVLIELQGVSTLGAWAGEPREEEVWRRWLRCPWVRRFERGQCSAEEFASGVVADWALDLAPETFLDEFRTWPKGLFPGAETLLRSLEGRVRRACFSNSNDLHWPRARDEMGLGDLLEDHYLSHEIGLVKPDAEAFDHVIEALGCRPGEILFLDDNQINVDGAIRVGLDAVRTTSPAGVRAVLLDRGILV